MKLIDFGNATWADEHHARVALRHGDLGEFNQCQTVLRDLRKDSRGGVGNDEKETTTKKKTTTRRFIDDGDAKPSTGRLDDNSVIEETENITVTLHLTEPHVPTRLVGAGSAFGNWNPREAPEFTGGQLTLQVPSHDVLAFKLVRGGDNGTWSWEPRGDRYLHAVSTEPHTLTWNHESTP